MKIKKPHFRSLKKNLSLMSGGNVVVAGDLILDCYVWGKVGRLNPEAPVPVVDVEKIEYRLGGAANVAANVAALGAKVKLIGMVGEDNHGSQFIDLLEENGISTEGILVNGKRPTTLKTRVIAHSQQVVRYDYEVVDPPGRGTNARLEKLFSEALLDSSIAILSDYNKGVFRGAFASRAIKAAARKKIKVAVDPKVPNIKRFEGAFVITPNHREASQILGYAIDGEKDVERAAKALVKKLRCPNILITRGKMGMSLFRENKPMVNVPTVARQVFDVTGAGDTAIAVFSTAVAVGSSLEEAMWLANAAAGVTVSKVGTASVTTAEIESHLKGEYARL